MREVSGVWVSVKPAFELYSPIPLEKYHSDEQYSQTRIRAALGASS